MGGQDKGLLPLNNRPLVVHVLDQLPVKHLDQIWLSANRNQAEYAALGRPVLTDLRPDFLGPLAGIEAALSASTAPYILVVPCDVPRLPVDLLPRLFMSLKAGATLAYAADAMRNHPTICLLPRTELSVIRTRLACGEHSLWRWQAAANAASVKFDFQFPNMNEPMTMVDSPHTY